MKNKNKDGRLGAVNATAELMSPEDLGLVERGEALKTACEQVGEKYLDLCRWIRTAKIDPRRVSTLLIPLGFAKQRVTEINRVAQCADELWNEYEARKVGMKQVLLLERGATEPEDVASVDSSEVEEAVGSGEADESPEDVERRKLLAMAKCAKTIMNAAEFLNYRRKKVWDLGNGWTVTLSAGGKGLRKSKRASRVEEGAQ